MLHQPHISHANSFGNYNVDVTMNNNHIRNRFHFDSTDQLHLTDTDIQMNKNHTTFNNKSNLYNDNINAHYMSDGDIDHQGDPKFRVTHKNNGINDGRVLSGNLNDNSKYPYIKEGMTATDDIDYDEDNVSDLSDPPVDTSASTSSLKAAEAKGKQMAMMAASEHEITPNDGRIGIEMGGIRMNGNSTITTPISTLSASAAINPLYRNSVMNMNNMNNTNNNNALDPSTTILAHDAQNLSYSRGIGTAQQLPLSVLSEGQLQLHTQQNTSINSTNDMSNAISISHSQSHLSAPAEWSVKQMLQDIEEPSINRNSSRDSGNRHESNHGIQNDVGANAVGADINNIIIDSSGNITTTAVSSVGWEMIDNKLQTLDGGVISSSGNVVSTAAAQATATVKGKLKGRRGRLTSFRSDDEDDDDDEDGSQKSTSSGSSSGSSSRSSSGSGSGSSSNSSSDGDSNHNDEAHRKNTPIATDTAAAITTTTPNSITTSTIGAVGSSEVGLSVKDMLNRVPESDTRKGRLVLRSLAGIPASTPTSTSVTTPNSQTTATSGSNSNSNSSSNGNREGGERQHRHSNSHNNNHHYRHASITKSDPSSDAVEELMRPPSHTPSQLYSSKNHHTAVTGTNDHNDHNYRDEKTKRTNSNQSLSNLSNPHHSFSSSGLSNSEEEGVGRVRRNNNNNTTIAANGIEFY